MAFTAVDTLVYGVVGVIALAILWYVLVRWPPDGAGRALYRLTVHQSGLTRRQSGPAVLALTAGIVPLLTRGSGALHLGYAIAAAFYTAGIYVGAVALANRPRKQYVDRAGGDPETLFRDGPNVVAGTATLADGENPLVAPVSGNAAVCYTVSHTVLTEDALDSAGTRFPVSFEVRDCPFTVDGEFGTARVDTEGAWISMLAGSPTDLGVDIEGELTGGPAENQVVVEAGETVPERLLEAVEYGVLPVDDRGRASTELRFKENAIAVGETVVVAGDAERGERFGSTRIRCDVPGGFVARGSFEQVAASLSASTGRNLALAVGFTLVGGLGLLWLAVP